MKHPFIMFAAITPLVALANPQSPTIDAEKLRTATPASAMLDEDVYAQDGEEIGELDEILISRDGKQVTNFVIETDTDVSLDNTASREGDRGEEGFEEADDELGEGADWTGNATQNVIANEVHVKPESVKYDSDNDRVVISERRLRSKTQATGEFNADTAGLKMDEIIGAEVNLSDEDSFGRVEDVMLSQDNTEVVAIVVDNWDGLNKHRRALPLDSARLSEEEEEVNFTLTQAQVEQMPEFNLDQYDDDGWDISDWTH